MNLHHDQKLFYDVVRAASQYLNINLVFVEKDYWITRVLKGLAASKYVNSAVFKGGTSLSKAYNLIERFSEDVDIAIINDGHKSGNEIKLMIRAIEKEITSELTEISIKGVTSKGSRFRKSVFEYASIENSSLNNRLIVETNSFANPFPYQQMTIQSMVYEFLLQTNNEKYIERYQLQPFTLNVLAMEQTLLEKLVSLVRFSYRENTIEGISEKIRHFYDLYYLMQEELCIQFVASDLFKERFNEILEHDKLMFDEPNGWQSLTVIQSPLFIQFDTIWNQVKGKYRTELTAYAYRPIPDDNDVATCFRDLINRLVE